ncbi:hypothetical protein AR457_02005 [Streptomyces agglomeratus]|uniref:Uncharacterized protein n=1 Tax=Streptomyces agglomeratus TaxID=285458 RepID=A0A1E5P1S2_9ACTN|nr:hypothetical protein [Streptomyces agglomeratus]OEJ23459.1 hypothetical protein AS594_02110 [Streptomyces agglomeratus]OEJ43052.1 hypothetical protein AR457_02005 [Streptomyces agglomeratus]
MDTPDDTALRDVRVETVSVRPQALGRARRLGKLLQLDLQQTRQDDPLPQPVRQGNMPLHRPQPRCLAISPRHRAPRRTSSVLAQQC